MNKDLDRIVLNLTIDKGPSVPVTIAQRPDGHISLIVTDSATGSEVQVDLFARQWKAVYQAIRWIARGDTPWPAES